MGNATSRDSENRSGRKGAQTRQLQRFFLRRLENFVTVRRNYAPSLDAGEFDIRLLDKAVYSTFCDCLDLGVGDEARAILRQEFRRADGTKTEDDISN